MTEAQVGFLCNIASKLNKPNNPCCAILRSHYLTKCREITAGYGLPKKHFSTEARCPRCNLEYTKETEIKLKPNDLSKQQKKRLRCKLRKGTLKGKGDPKALLYGNRLVKTCSFCQHTMIKNIRKPEKDNSLEKNILKPIVNKKDRVNKKKIEMVQKTKELKPMFANVYTNAFDVFSLKNEKNTLATSLKAPPKIIKNSKRKKDKFAGLCQQAVLASAKLKEDKNKCNNKLNLFLKPSS